jgi:hypothetical protein
MTNLRCLIVRRQSVARASGRDVGTTRSRVNFFMNTFRKLGFIACNEALKINNSLLTGNLGS